MKKPKAPKENYKNSKSRGMAALNKRRREENRPRLIMLKCEMGCQVCGAKNIPPEQLDADHLGPKSQPIARLISRRWDRVLAEIFGVRLKNMKKTYGPTRFVCKRYHIDRHRIGDLAKPCETPLDRLMEKKKRRS